MSTIVFSRATIVPHATARWCSAVHLSFRTLQRGNALLDALRHGFTPAVYSGEDAERPERHTHAERGQESVLRTSCSRCQEEPGAYSRCSGLTGSPDLAWSLSRMSANIRS
ncbi:DUF1534 domain-containing protein [Pseudomonas savastanoi pv. phaseolicola]|nr:DUF1534 domain-containing protein [Pseudomonas savastanoi pv. phaseolicola]MBN3474717.1 DUF1534 domain-containing protein [Pseudomonas savastanoi pv. phaseolicola]